MKNVPMRLLGGVALLSVALVWATSPPSATVTWTAPTAYLDGSVLPVADIDHYTLSWSPAGGSPTGGILTVKALTATVPVVCGTVQFTVTATTSATALYPNATSQATGPVPFASGVSCAPNPPGALAVH